MRKISKALILLFGILFGFASCQTETIPEEPPVVTEKQLVSIKVTKKPAKLDYIVGETMDFTGMEVTAYYSDMSSQVVTDYTVSFDLEHTNYVTVGWHGKKVGFTVNIRQDSIVRIEVTQKPAKLTYDPGEAFDPDGMNVMAVFASGEKVSVSEWKTDFDEVSKTSGINKTVTVTYLEFKTTFNVTITDKTVNLIQIRSKPAKVDYYSDEEFDSAGLKVIALYDDDTFKEIGNYTTDFDQVVKTEGTAKKVTVTFMGKTASFNINVTKAVVTSLELDSSFVKTTYYIGENFDQTGLVVTAIYNSGNRKNLGQSEYTTNGSSVVTSAGENKTVTVTYSGFSVEYKITVIDVVVSRILLDWYTCKRNYYEGEEFSDRGLNVVAYYNNGQQKFLKNSEYTIDGSEVVKTPGKDKLVTVTYSGKSATYTITVTAVVVNELKMILPPVKTEYRQSDEFDPEGMLLRAYYNNGVVEEVKDFTTDFDNVAAEPGVNKTLTISYGGKSVVISIDVVLDGLQSILIKVKPSKISYYLGESFDSTGLVVEAKFDAGIQTVNDWTCDGNEVVLSIGKDKIVTVAYGGRTAIFYIDVDGDPLCPQLIILPDGTDGSVGRDGKYCYFGSFPKTIKDSSVFVDETKSMVMGAYTYYMGSDKCWYMKILEDGYFANINSKNRYSDGTQVQGISSKSYKYFKVEPIKWRIVTEKYDYSNKALLFAEEVLIANVPYYNDEWENDWEFENKRSVGKDINIEINNYEYSLIRAWLNGLEYYYNSSSGTTVKKTDFIGKGFIQIAFTNEAQKRISVTKVESGYSYYNKRDTNDRIFMLSRDEVKNQNYKFTKENLYRNPSDFALANGSNIGTEVSYWLRTGLEYDGLLRACIIQDGVLIDGLGRSVYDTHIGVVPALCVDLP